MTARQQWMIVAAVIAVMVGGALTASHFLQDELQQVTIGSEAPKFSAITVDSTPVSKSLDAYKGQVVLLNVWATYCIPCRTEMPSIEALYKDFKPKGLHVVAVSVDAPGKMQAIRDFVKEFGLSFEILYDSVGTIEKQYRTTGYPETFVISRDGIIHKKMIGADNWNSEGNRRLLEGLLAEPAR